MDLKNDEVENEKGKAWLEEDGIIKLKLGKNCDFKEAERLGNEFIKIAKTLPTKSKVSIDISITNPRFDIVFRKNIVEILKSAFKDPGFEKIALWGSSVKIIKVITSFVLGATGFKNIKYFDTEEEVLKWFKEGK
jgi:hypothetical protein